MFSKIVNLLIAVGIYLTVGVSDTFAFDFECFNSKSTRAPLATWKISLDQDLPHLSIGSNASAGHNPNSIVSGQPTIITSLTSDLKDVGLKTYVLHTGHITYQFRYDVSESKDTRPVLNIVASGPHRNLAERHACQEID